MRITVWSGPEGGPPLKEQMPLIAPRPVPFIAAEKDPAERAVPA